MQYLHSLHLRVIAFRCIICCIMCIRGMTAYLLQFEGKNLRQVHPDSSPSPRAAVAYLRVENEIVVDRDSEHPGRDIIIFLED